MTAYKYWLVIWSDYLDYSSGESCSFASEVFDDQQEAEKHALALSKRSRKNGKFEMVHILETVSHTEPLGDGSEVKLSGEFAE